MRRHLLAALALLTLTGCTLAAPTPPVLPSAQRAPAVTSVNPEAIDQLITGGLLGRLLEDARRTLADIDAWKTAGQLTPVNEANARLCPNAVLTTVPDFQAELLSLRDALLALKPAVTPGSDGGLYPLELVTKLEYGPRGRAPDLSALATNARARLRLLDTSCRGLGLKAMNDLLIFAGRVGLIAETGGLAGGGPAALGLLRGLPLR